MPTVLTKATCWRQTPLRAELGCGSAGCLVLLGADNRARTLVQVQGHTGRGFWRACWLGNCAWKMGTKGGPATGNGAKITTQTRSGQARGCAAARPALAASWGAAVCPYQHGPRCRRWLPLCLRHSFSGLSGCHQLPSISGSGDLCPALCPGSYISGFTRCFPPVVSPHAHPLLPSTGWRSVYLTPSPAGLSVRMSRPFCLSLQPLSTAGVLSSASTASNRSRNRTRYRTKAVSSEVDESLFGGVKVTVPQPLPAAGSWRQWPTGIAQDEASLGQAVPSPD